MTNRYAASFERIEKDLANARLLCGQRLIGVMHDQPYFNNEKCLEDLGSLIWQCCANQTVAIYTLNDGESVGADLSILPIPTDFKISDVDICSWRREDLLTRLSAGFLAGKVITEVEGFIERTPTQVTKLIAFKITIETGDYLVYINHCDNAVVLINEPPDQLEDTELYLVEGLDQGISDM